ncbi:MAG: DUF2130 domain-containing protein [Chloroflexi bacterium]|jgi:hypothetical protein|nr:DUF2130 domain-containing protein [Chloroflexota bacterium]
MAEDMIKCPNCGFDIPISEALTHQIREGLKSELETGVKKREAELLETEKRLSHAKASIDEQVAAKIRAETAKIQAQAAQKAGENVRVELEDLKAQVTEKERKIAESQQTELDLRKQQRELEDRQKALELEVARKIDIEREKIKQETLQQFSEDHRLKDAEREKTIKDLQQALQDAQRKAEQGSMQMQGEVLELDLENILRTAFPFDDIKEVPKGIRGADVIQTVYDSTRKPCGIILWEAKRTKNWSDAWIQKLKDDQREIGADIAVIITEAMPKDVDNLDLVNGVWVTRYNLAIGLATALRQQTKEVTFARQGAVGKGEKMEVLYEYLSGPEFRQRIEAIVETFTIMNAQLDREKRAMTKIWKEREKQIERITLNTASMYGAMRGIIGASLPEVELLELGPVEPQQLEAELEWEES